ncbi:transcriptional repressor AgaR [Novosphingobium resinovorum]|uniref:DeoR family transcriptional regulator n=1 Tax=Novosphingobium resinovorum TaxID=158500 RepID=A0A031JQB9_9SPHN|nr:MULTISPECIES: transcriptional repressor AgaR [Sphingomonadaceae]EJU12545.1 DeoR family transcriptional regulator [Sphingomonas sp. LH128]EZP78328.1 DeoR family transcriptional regulator [Novosphingobium resinovorum]MBF7014755.1 DeoR/GlpR transcriptional regulator [Novosphingobium sp. HR1a]WJM24763.1 transcriptional repressor AgaR [Novosphingobium resinovorum]
MVVTRDTSRRRQEISTLVRERGSVQVTDLSERYGVSMQTIRKDLHFLAKKGVAERSYGGAISADAVNVVAEPPLETKRAANPDAKARIGALAAAMVQPGDSVVLDSGTTTLQIAHHLPDDEEITVLTNDLDILCALARKERIRVVMLGGALRRRNRAFYGAQTESALSDLHVDKLFLGVDGFDFERGITTHYEPEAMLNRKMAKAARQVIAVTDRSKFGKVCLHRILNVEEIDDLVTDAADSDAVQSAADRLGFRLHRA